jgi:uncharacterized membrane protein
VKIRSSAGRFAFYGALGLASEIVFTGSKDLLRSRGRSFRGHTSLLMFPVYGLIRPLFEPAHDLLRYRWRAPARAVVYAAGFLAVEYGAGRVYRALLGKAPWDYSHATLNVGGLIRFDYAPLWALAGLGLERVHDAIRP